MLEWRVYDSRALGMPDTVTNPTKKKSDVRAKKYLCKKNRQRSDQWDARSEREIT